MCNVLCGNQTTVYVVCEMEAPQLVKPTVSVGNVPQLTQDVLVVTLRARRAGFLRSSCYVPLVGNNPYSEDGADADRLHVSTEVYVAPDKRVALVQIRSPIIKGRKKRARREMLDWVEAGGFSRVVILSSSFAHMRTDKQLVGPPYRFLLSPSLEATERPVVEALGWTQLEPSEVIPGLGGPPELAIPGGGLSKGLFLDGSARGLPVAVLLAFCSEGDNIPDALALADRLQQWLRLADVAEGESTPRWKTPSSWKMLFGGEIPPSLF
ncbi:proteasome assembly chaperone 2 isoform X1 [Petromyzon marinus]|uniref:proteasome assembly chaperone 2 isoform X1 n=1 Tax=Petromyzon marinus TaxID=7757 RepID=UPI003F70AA17